MINLIDFVNTLVISDDTVCRVVDLDNGVTVTESWADLQLLKPSAYNFNDKIINACYISYDLLTIVLLNTK